MEILLHSKNKDSIENIQKLIKGSLRVDVAKENELDNLKKYQLLLVDITGKDSGPPFPKNYTTAINKAKIPTILILKISQLNLLDRLDFLLDDFVLEKQVTNELEARIRLALFNKKGISLNNSIVVGNLVLNLDKYELMVDKQPIELTFKEYELLRLLLENRDKVFSRKKLLSIIWEYDYYGGSRTVDVHIRRLRSKLPSPYHLMIKTVRNVGYMFSS
ncbi:MAG: winged helix-turn-helix domain-containing protein [Actinomycetota bacterium]